MFINGQFVESSTDKWHDVHNPVCTVLGNLNIKLSALAHLIDFITKCLSITDYESLPVTLLEYGKFVPLMIKIK